MQAACGLAQIKKIKEFIDARRRNFEYLKNGLKDLDFLHIAQPTLNSNPSWFGFPLTVRENQESHEMKSLNF